MRMTNEERRRELIKALAEFLAGDLAHKSVAVQVERSRPQTQVSPPRWANMWAILFQHAGLQGWATVEEAERKLSELFPTRDLEAKLRLIKIQLEGTPMQHNIDNAVKLVDSALESFH